MEIGTQDEWTKCTYCGILSFLVEKKMTEEPTDIDSADNVFEKLPDHLLIEIFIRVPISEWAQVSCVKMRWARLFQGECLWQTALLRTWPTAGQAKRWPGPIRQGLSRR